MAPNTSSKTAQVPVAAPSASTAAPEAPATGPKATATQDRKEELEQRYISLLEKRVEYLQSLVDSQSAEKEPPARPQRKQSDRQDFVSPRSSRADNSTDGKPVPAKSEDKAEEQPVPDPSEVSRYAYVMSRWDGRSGGRRDTEIGRWNELEGKAPSSKRAFTFRRVMDLTDEKKFKYSEVDVESRELRGLLRKVIGDSYPGQSWEGNTINLIAPFAPVVHYWKELSETSRRNDDSESPRVQAARKDLNNLLECISTCTELESYFKTRDSNLESHTVTYQTIWTLFRPGTLVVARPFMNLPQVFEVKASPDPWEDRRLTIECWGYDWNGKEIVRVTFEFPIEKFRGTKEISSLFCYPLEFYRDEKGNFDESLRAELVQRGKWFLELCQTTGARQMFEYDGQAFSSRRSLARASADAESKTPSLSMKDDTDLSLAAEFLIHKTFKVKGRYIVDAAAYLQFGPGIPLLGKYEPTDVEPFSQAHDEQGVDIDEHQRLLYPPRVLGYATQQKMWAQFKVHNTTPVPTDLSNAFKDKLELDEKDKKMIKALVENHESSKDTSQAQVNDIIESKGKNLVILLHGPPGVGKTLTAETIAEATGKPLLVVTVAEIGLDASKAEKSLEQIFYLAGVWEAILLIDEADVFLESRFVMGDPNRNALVSVLLRVLEYFEGVMILTTNRITSLDIAVQSRIHLAIRYNDLSKDQKIKIFNIFLSQLVTEGKVDGEGIGEWIRWVGSEAEVNGRQIRNIVSSAYLLARSQHRNLRREDLQDVNGIMKKFQKQLETLTAAARKQNEGQLNSLGGYG
ncbi:uncharacterized protein PV07_00240 [Cladophialophora immunda]|uniref:AAA+ ATPase domain-containing protein n=1 Tax=Cladophialophora immunda TaxID=569365 RepID=A0A0D2CTY8_9EURO|nr:uncharacterized protein PV07_00240 [Cladophialophora immunda]KIW33385.1 hypothetical protein PV07_00240 [Cladophialophora immunda]